MKFQVSGICNATSVNQTMVNNVTIQKYRTIDGSYNNLKHPEWGQTGQVFPRMVEPDYADGT